MSDERPYCLHCDGYAKLAESEAQAAAMREALIEITHGHAGLFMGDLPGLIERIDVTAREALAGTAGRALLEELAELRADVDAYRDQLDVHCELEDAVRVFVTGKSIDLDRDAARAALARLDAMRKLK